AEEPHEHRVLPGERPLTLECRAEDLIHRQHSGGISDRWQPHDPSPYAQAAEFARVSSTSTLITAAPGACGIAASRLPATRAMTIATASTVGQGWSRANCSASLASWPAPNRNVFEPSAVNACSSGSAIPSIAPLSQCASVHARTARLNAPNS